MRIGTIESGNNVGIDRNDLYIWMYCPICMVPHWVMYYRFMQNKTDGRCKQCHCRILHRITKGQHTSTEFKKGHKQQRTSGTWTTENSSGAKSTQWKGGRVIVAKGYIRIKSPIHPYRNNVGYVLEHRLVVEKIIGRFLERHEKVHHIKPPKSNNKPKNLMAFISDSAHQRFEHNNYVRPDEIIFDGRKL